jgi:hypothetical protein
MKTDDINRRNDRILFRFLLLTAVAIAASILFYH